MKIEFTMLEQDFASLEKVGDDAPAFFLQPPPQPLPLPEQLLSLEPAIETAPIVDTNLPLETTTPFIEKVSLENENITKPILAENLEPMDITQETILEKPLNPVLVNTQNIESDLKQIKPVLKEKLAAESTIIEPEKITTSETIKKILQEISPKKEPLALEIEKPIIEIENILPIKMEKPIPNLMPTATVLPEIPVVLKDTLVHFFNEKLPTLPQVSLNPVTPDMQPRLMRTELIDIQPVLIDKPAGFQNESYLAKIKVHPENAGEIAAKIEVLQNTVKIDLLTEHPQVKQFLEMHIQHLQDSFQKANMDLTQVSIETQARKDYSDQGKDQQRYRQENEALPTEKSYQSKHYVSKQKSHSIIDTYA